MLGGEVAAERAEKWAYMRHEYETRTEARGCRELESEVCGACE